MAATPVTPQPGLVSQVVTGGTPVTVVAANPNGGYIQNPVTATETLYVNPVGAAGTTANGATFGLSPGAVWEIIPGQTTPTTVNAITGGHIFSAVFY